MTTHSRRDMISAVFHRHYTYTQCYEENSLLLKNRSNNLHRTKRPTHNTHTGRFHKARHRRHLLHFPISHQNFMSNRVPRRYSRLKHLATPCQHLTHIYQRHSLAHRRPLTRRQQDSTVWSRAMGTAHHRQTPKGTGTIRLPLLRKQHHYRSVKRCGSCQRNTGECLRAPPR